MQPRHIGNRKSYDPPIMRTRSLSQAILFLVGYAYIGDAGARDLLELLFPDAAHPQAGDVTQGSRP
jgi:hypothetical protein